MLSEIAQLSLDTFYKDCIVLLNEEPLYAYLVEDSRVMLVRKGVDVAAVSMENGDFVFYINPEGYLTYSQGERLFIIKHEWTHWIDEHPLQAVDFPFKNLWNLACDIAINQYLETDYCVRPKDAQMPEMYELEAGLTPEKYYTLLDEQRRNEKLKINKSLSSMAKGANLKQPVSSEQNEGPKSVRGPILNLKKLQNGYFLIRIRLQMVVFTNDESFFDKEGNTIRFDDLQEKDFVEAVVTEIDDGLLGLQLRLTDPKDEDERGSGNGHSSESNEHEIHPDELENLHPNWDKISKQSAHMAKQELQEKIMNAAESIGDNIPGALKEKIERLKKAKTNWKGELSIFMGTVRGRKKQYTYRKRNRRIEYAPGAKTTTRLKLVIIIDTSASVTKEQLEMFDAEIRKIYSSIRDIQIIIMTCDTQIRDIFEYNQKKMNEEIEFNGRGGTDFSPPFEMILKREHKLLKKHPDAVLYLTDGFGIAPDTFPIPTLWCLTPKGRKPYKRTFGSEDAIDWGRTIHLSEE